VEHMFTVDSGQAGVRADIFLSHRSGMTRSRIRKLFAEGCVTFGDGSPLKPSYHVEPNDTIRLVVPPVREPEFLPEDIPLDIAYEDDWIIVVNKPPGMVVHPGRGNVTGTLAAALLHHCKSLSGVGGPLRPGIVHRLDKNTSGLLVAALNDEIHVALSRMLQDREFRRIYTAIVWGRPEPESGTIEAPLGRHPRKPTLRAVVTDGKPAVTHYETEERYDFLTKLRITLQTGRTHQVRVHLAHVGHHVFGDPTYGGREERLRGFSPEIRQTARRLLGEFDRQALHAGRLEFDHPATGERLRFEIPPPEDFIRLEKALRGE